jgi:hypothetical protein
MTTTKLPRGVTVPPGLRPRARRFFVEGITDFGINTDVEVELLAAAATALSRAIEATARLRREGLTVNGPRGLSKHPCVDIERASTAEFAKITRQLTALRHPRRPGAVPGSNHHLKTRK